MAETLSPVLSSVTEQKVTAILSTLAARRQSLALAESCTGGLLSSLFTDVPGCSHVFLAGYVAYASAAKTEMLGLPADQIAAYGPVSAPVARAMAQAAQVRSGSDWALGVTGFAGPAGPGEEAGLVHFATARRGGCLYHEVQHYGDQGRGKTRLLCIETAVEMLHRQIVVNREIETQ